MTDFAEIDLVDDDGIGRGTFRIGCLADSGRWRGMEALEISNGADGAPVRLLEETHYQFAIVGLDSVGTLEPRELFSRDRGDGLRGRLSAGRVTGTVRISMETQHGRLHGDVEVRSRKLDYETEYRRMMTRLAEEGAELVQSSFAAGSFGGFDPDRLDDARTLYQRFAFVQSLLDSEVFAEAIEVIRYRPHLAHRTEDDLVDPARSLKPDAMLANQLASAVGRQPLARPIGRLTSVPVAVTRQVHVETFDTLPNRFVRFALVTWKDLASQVHDLLDGNGPGAERGRREARRLELRLDHLLSTVPALMEAGRLDHFPASNTVLHARAGYRDIFRSFLVGNVAASLSWDGGEDVFSAGKRDVATLYEYWVFLELARIVETIPGFTFDRSDLVKETRGSLQLELKSGTAVVLRGEGECRGRPVKLSLWFNRTFGAKSSGEDGSWTVAMRPDCSLQIRPQGGTWESDTWVHFDAKYRVEHAGYFGLEDVADEQAADGEPSGPAGGAPSAKRDDLRKMHAYRDAIRRTAGAYVLYPGDDGDQGEQRRQYHEVLPGLGAFVLRPSETGEATAVVSGRLRDFLTEVIDHAAATGTGRERARYWEDEAYSGGLQAGEVRHDFSGALDRPAADTTVLVGFVRSAAHREWIDSRRLYNLRADPEREGSVTFGSEAARARIVVLYAAADDQVVAYRTTGALVIRTGDELADDGYPGGTGSSGSGSLYLGLALASPVAVPFTAAQLRALAPSSGAPAAYTWHELSEAAAAT